MNGIVATVDRRVKERLIGATVLVALLIIVVPELLPGSRPPRPAPTERAAGAPLEVEVDTATSRATPTVQPEGAGASGAAAAADSEPSEAHRPADDGGPTASGIEPAPAQPSASSTGEGVEVPHAARPTSNPAGAAARSSLEGAPSGPITAAGGGSSAPRAAGAWSIQLGSFASRANAEKLLHRLKAGGASAYLLTTGSGAHTRYRVRVGPLADRSAAEQARLRFKAAGHVGTVVPPGGTG